MGNFNVQIVNNVNDESSNLYPVSKAENINNVSDGLKYILDNIGSDYSITTSSTAGLMSATDKTKLVSLKQEVNDSNTTTTTTWSSNKIQNELNKILNFYIID